MKDDGYYIAEYRYLYIEEEAIVVKLDRENKLIMVYDSTDGVELKSEGILRDINDDLNSIIAGHFKINVGDYGVAVTLDSVEVKREDIC